MKDGFIKVAAGTPDVQVADCEFNASEIIKMVHEMEAEGAKVMVFPELCITAYTCGDLFWQENLLEEAKKQLFRIAEETKDVEALIFVGLPLEYKGKLYNVAAGLNHGEVLGFVPKIHIPNYNEFYEARYFTSGENVDGTVTVRTEDYGFCHMDELDDNDDVEFDLEAEIEALEEAEFEELEEVEDDPDYIDEDEEELMEQDIPISSNVLFTCPDMPKLRIAAEICEDLWVLNPPSVAHAYHGANLIVNLSASDEVVGKDSYRRSLVSAQSARLLCGYIYATAGEGESTQDVVYSGHHLICENGSVLAEAKRFTNEIIYADIDVQKLAAERRKMTSFPGGQTDDYFEQEFSLEVKENKITRTFPKAPFVPDNQDERDKRCDEILSLQSMGLKKRLEHTNCKHAVVGISGGLDSTLAVLVTARAFDLLDIPRENLICVTMPCFGTTDRTYQNAVSLIKELGATLKEVRIEKAVRQHFADIGHDENNHDVTYENSQARERTQILMDMANQYNGMVIGTGDMSELALGWATYNGDHMSMYAVNCSVPKTLVRYLVLYYAETTENKKLSEVLMDVLDTPVSPELLPPVDGVISQKTEDLVGPYELHDFFLYYMLRFGFPKSKLYRMAKLTFDGVYDDETIKKWLDKFYWRFFSQQFKRSCLPDGPKVGSVAVSPRGDLRMPSDASPTAWI